MKDNEIIMAYSSGDDDSLQKFKCILLYDDEVLHLSNDYYDKDERGLISLLCQGALDTSRISRHWEGSLHYIERLRLEEQMIHSLAPSLCENCYLSMKKRTSRRAN
jgi:hypothetical protein